MKSTFAIIRQTRMAVEREREQLHAMDIKQPRVAIRLKVRMLKLKSFVKQTQKLLNLLNVIVI